LTNSHPDFRVGGRASMRSWDIGTRADCDVVVDSPVVSARHCQLTQTADGYFLNDLGSTNGTFVNGSQITSPTRLSPGASITLGRTMTMPWPPELVRFVQVGRLADNDVVIDDQRVSGHHAQLVFIEGFEIRIEDRGSSNGTYLNSTDRRVTSPTVITESDTVYFGTLAITVARLLAGLRERKKPVPEFAPPSAVTEPIPEPPVALPAVAVSNRYGWLVVWLVQAPVFAILIVALFGRQVSMPITEANWAAVGSGIASTTFALALAAIWLGSSLAVADAATGPLPAPGAGDVPMKLFVPFGKRVAILVSLCALGCAAIFAIVYWGSGLRGQLALMYLVVLMAALIGLFLGFVVELLAPKRAIIATILLAVFIFMALLGGLLWPLPGMSTPMRVAAAATPTRWAFEGLLLLESAEHQAPAIPAETGEPLSEDLVESLFPSNSENRMGVRADALALGSMLIGLAALAAFIWGVPRTRP
jgi:pSer/pThr/pTyr-binding forkhead associated (FHA) protein